MMIIIYYVNPAMGDRPDMKASSRQAAEHRQQIVEAAAQLFCEAGLEGVGLREITHAAGLTHGGFYNQFDSKEALFAEAAELALRARAADAADAFARPNAIPSFGDSYLREENINAAQGCPVATLAAEVSRQPLEVQAAFARGLRAFLSAGRTVKVGSQEWRESTAALATMVGTVLMARAVRDGDPELSTAILEAGRAAVGSG